MGKRGPKSAALQHAHQTDRQPYFPDGYPWDKPGLSRSGRVVSFIQSLPITSGMHAGRKFKLRPWQKKIIREIYRTRRGKRIVRTALITVARKNGKSALASAMALCHLLGPEAEERGQCFSAAADREQAAIIFREMEAVILRVPEFEARCHVQSFHKQITDTISGTVYRAMSADARKAHGLSPSFVIYDELAQARDRELYDNLSTGTAARAEPLMVIISTQSADPHHVMSEAVDYGKQILAGTIKDETYSATVYMADMEDDPWDEATWYKANPALGDFRSLEEMRIFAEQAKKIPQKEAVFKSLYLNLPVSADARFVPVEDWLACQGTAECTGPCFMGLDLGSTRDLTALAAYWPHTGAVRLWCWLPADPPLSDRSQSDKVPYTTWEKEGFIETWPGKATDHRAAALRLAELCAQYEVAAIGFDRWRIDQMLLYVEEIGAKLPLEPHGQGFKDFSPAIEALERLILDHGLHCGDNPVLTWAMSNVAVLTDPAGGRKFDKAGALTRRIDPAVALAMAVGLGARMAPPEQLDFECSLLTM